MNIARCLIRAILVLCISPVLLLLVLVGLAHEFWRGLELRLVYAANKQVHDQDMWRGDF